MVKLKDIMSIPYLFKILNSTTKGRELVENFNRSVLFTLQRQAAFNKLIADPNVISSVQFIFKFKRKRFDKLAQTLLMQMYDYVKDENVIIYEPGDNISLLIKNTAKYIKTNANIIQMAYNLWKEKHSDADVSTDGKENNKNI